MSIRRWKRKIWGKRNKKIGRKEKERKEWKKEREIKRDDGKKDEIDTEVWQIERSKVGIKG